VRRFVASSIKLDGSMASCSVASALEGGLAQPQGHFLWRSVHSCDDEIGESRRMGPLWVLVIVCARLVRTVKNHRGVSFQDVHHITTSSNLLNFIVTAIEAGRIPRSQKILLGSSL
jgi:hypothetical protein